ncbi:MAG: VOC family protein [Chitinophagales bacterium]
MVTQIFVNLPVKNLDKSIAFFTSLGFKFNPQFTDQNATCMIVGDDSFIMLLAEPFFKTFIKKEITDSSKSTEVIVAISLENRQKVDEMITKAMASGAKESNDTQDQGWMYSRSFQDPDGHLWEVFYMDPAAMSKG